MRKVRISKKPHRAALQRYQLRAGGEYKRCLERQYGSQGAASDVRVIDPKTGLQVDTIKTRKPDHSGKRR